jgi:hypothetical protein
MKTTSNGRRPQIIIVENLSHHYSDLLQILNLSQNSLNEPDIE